LQLLSEVRPEFTTTPKERKQRLQSLKTYLSGKVNIGHQKVEVRKNIIDVDYGFSETTKLLVAVNHPATQLLSQINNYYNKEHDHDPEVRRLVQNVTTVIAWNQLRAILDYQVEAYTDQTILYNIGAIATQPGHESSDSPAA